jgi:hypothetical protein
MLNETIHPGCRPSRIVRSTRRGSVTAKTHARINETDAMGRIGQPKDASKSAKPVLRAPTVMGNGQHLEAVRLWPVDDR